ncbi:MAG: hypothetical protein NQU41_02915 [Candidatus Methanosuratincola sp.]|nr:hypothetical protein [Candidatus Methanosuratincola sp.]
MPRLNGLKPALAIALLVAIMMPLLPPAEGAVNITLRSDTQVLVAGAENTIRFTVANTGNNTANEVVASASIGTSLTGGNLLMIVGGDGRYNLSTIGPGEESQFNMTVYVSPSAVGQIIQISFTISYRNESAVATTSVTRSVGFSVSNRDLGSATLVPRIVPGEINPGQNNTLTLAIDNVGKRGATNISVSLGYPGSSAGASQAGTSSILTALTTTPTGTVQGSSQFIIYDSSGRWIIDSIDANGTVEIPVTLYALPSTAGSVFLFPVQLSYTDGFTYVQETRYAGTRALPAPSEATSFSIQLSTQELVAGRVNSLEMRVKNVGAGQASGVVLGIGLSQTTSGSISIPSSSSSLVLIGSDGTWVLGSMAPGEEKAVNLNVYVPASASGSITSLSTSLYYTDSLSRSRQETKQLGILVKGEVSLVVLETSTFPQNITLGKPFSVSVTMINIGSAPAKSAILSPSGNSGLRPTSSDRIFIGDIAVDVPSSFTLSMVGENITSGAYTLNLSYTYKDSLGQIQTSSLLVPLNLKVAEANNGSQQPSQPAYSAFLGTYWPYLVAVAVAIAAAAIYMKRRKRGSAQ